VTGRGRCRLIAGRALQGVGIGRFPQTIGLYTEYPLRKEDPKDAHNAFVLVAAEMGLPTVAVLLLFLASLLATTVRTYFSRRPLRDRAIALACLGSVVGLIASCMLGSRLSDESMIGYFWILAAVAVLVGRPSAPPRPRPRLRPTWP